MNFYAPVALNGVEDDGDFFSYVYDVTLTANEIRSDLVPIQNDADFLLRAIAVNAKTGIFKVRFNRSGLYFLSSSYIHSSNLESDAASPLPIIPELLFKAGGRAGIEIVDLSGASNTVQIAFVGVNAK